MSFQVVNKKKFLTSVRDH